MVAITVSDTKHAEQAWHDEWYRTNASREFPKAPTEFQEYFRRVQLTPFCDGGWGHWGDIRQEAFRSMLNIGGKSVLDYGCGSGQLGIYLAMRGARVAGFDLSPEGIRVARQAAVQYGLECDFRALDAEQLDFGDDSFDLVVGFGVLHHVIKYPGASIQLRRVMRRGARAVFLETLWDNPLINCARNFTKAESEAGDAHLTEKSIREFAATFSGIELQKRHLLYMTKRLASLPPRD